MWAELCDIYSPNAEKQEDKPIKAVDKYYRKAMIRCLLNKVLHRRK